ncbi:exodeoxyribonuclease VII large subunit [Hydrogenophaga pseudoflava]|uniref:exodeoxyribonuclease VII large subunit n=1 Tax=Hydrogenophaga pseudoflava TaxID=47421 RepID=UPI0027E3BF0C|nr:exodeoxyribonuclease VII large subunit [Hydrogenophaga pseudoflava]MDQ7744462.1 exodeoxyribonuclease VII large subunit [Hydrogenophaga pseudoflava]
MQAIADALSVRFNPVAVRGEVSGFSRAASGHCYFSLKDESGQLRCAMFRRAADQLQFVPRDGLLVQAQGRLDVYGPRGDLQLIVDGLKPAGQGALFEQFVRLKARLEAEGLFDPQRKRQLPPEPRSIAVVTSLGAAALRDVVTALRRRVPHIPVRVHPASVQGAQAPQEICRALEQAYQRFRDLDEGQVLLLVRGGGSLEDLWAFNDESVVRTVVRAPMPVICGVGHETDFTLSDFAADLRAPTPTAAAELCAPPRQQRLDELDQLETDLRGVVWRGLDLRSQRLDRLAQRLGRPSSRLHDSSQRLSTLQHRLTSAVRLRQQRHAMQLERLSATLPQAVGRALSSQAQRLERCGAALGLLDPTLVLERGYTLLTDREGRAITRAEQIQPGQLVTARLADGSVGLTADR